MADQLYVIAVYGYTNNDTNSALEIQASQGTVEEDQATLKNRFGRLLDQTLTNRGGISMVIDATGANDLITAGVTSGANAHFSIIADSAWDDLLRQKMGWQSNGPSSPQSADLADAHARARNLLQSVGLSIPAEIQIGVALASDKFAADAGWP